MKHSWYTQCEEDADETSTSLGAQGFRRLQHVEQLRVVDLQKHSGDLTGQAGVHVLNQGEQALTCTEP